MAHRRQFREHLASDPNKVAIRKVAMADEAKRNPYFARFAREWGWWDTSARHAPRSHKNDLSLVDLYAWAVPNEEALKALVEAGPIVEIGAGMGYWASMVRRRGGKILAFDREVPSQSTNDFARVTSGEWTEVQEGDETALGRADCLGATLFLCWPVDQTQACLDRYEGDRVIYVGEEPEGCTDDGPLFTISDWTMTRKIAIPRWSGSGDAFYIFDRGALAKAAAKSDEEASP